MKNYPESRKYFLAGLFVFLCVFLAVWLMFMLGSEKGLTDSKFQMQVLYKDVGGLIQGSPIRLSGVNVGTVGDIEFLKGDILDRRVKVILNVKNKYKHLIDSSAKFSIVTEGVLGEKLIEIDVSGDGVPLNFDRPVLGEESLDIQALAEAFAEASSSFKKTSQSLNEDLSSVDIKELTDVLTESARSLISTSKEVNVTLQDFRQTMKDVARDIDPVAESMTTALDSVPPVTKEFEEALLEIRETTRKTKRLVDRFEQQLIEGDLFKVF